MDLMEQFVTRSKISAAVLGRGNQFLLAYLNEKEISEPDRLLANERGYFFCGCVGLVDGRVEVECELFLEARILTLRAALRFAENLYAPKTAHVDRVKWLEDLHKLEDNRPN
jgi:hypothetical protein